VPHVAGRAFIVAGASPSSRIAAANPCDEDDAKAQPFASCPCPLREQESGGAHKRRAAVLTVNAAQHMTIAPPSL